MPIRVDATTEKAAAAPPPAPAANTAQGTRSWMSWRPTKTQSTLAVGAVAAVVSGPFAPVAAPFISWAATTTGVHLAGVIASQVATAAFVGTAMASEARRD